MSQRAKLLQTSVCLTSNSPGKGMRIGAKIELGFDDDFFAGCEMESELFAVIVGGRGHDDGGVAFRIVSLGRRGGSGLGLGDLHMCTPPPGGGGVGMVFSCIWGRWATRFAGRERTKQPRQRNADQRKN